MASRSQRPRRLTAEEALRLFQEDLHDGANSDEDLDLDLDVSDDDSYNEETDRSSESDANEDNPSTSCVLGPSITKKSKSSLGKRSRAKQNAPCSCGDAGAQASSSDGGWKEIPTNKPNNPEHRTSNSYRFVPTHEPGVIAEFDETSSAFTCLQAILDNNVIDSLCTSVNDYAKLKSQRNNPPRRRSVYADWVQTDREEMLRFMAVLIVIGMNKRPRVRDYFRKTPAYWYTPWMYQIFPSRDRFLALYHTMLHTGDAASQSKEKIEPFLNLVISKSQEAFYPFKELSIDEMVIGFKGRWANKQFNASKPKKYHIKTFGLCDSLTGYVVNILLYYGKETSYNPEVDPDSQHAVKVFQTLLTENVGKGHHVFADRFYSSLPVIRYLQSRGMHYTGTLMPTRKGFVPNLAKQKLEHRECKWYLSEENDIILVAWRDKKAKKPRIMVSTDAAADIIQVQSRRGHTEKPAIIHKYNMAMNGCDMADQAVAYYGVHERRSTKWWKKIFFWLIEVMQFNSHILYTLSHPNQPRTELRIFKDKIIKEMQSAIVSLNAITPEPEPAQPVQVERHNAKKMHLIEYVDDDRNCVYCSKPTDRKRTKFVCSGCLDRPHLHPKHCFMLYHKSNAE